MISSILNRFIKILSTRANVFMRIDGKSKRTRVTTINLRIIDCQTVSMTGNLRDWYDGNSAGLFWAAACRVNNDDNQPPIAAP